MKRLAACLLIAAAASFGATGLRLIDAVKKVDAQSVRALLAAHVPVNAAEADGSTALHWAAQRDNVEIADLLIAAGANPKAVTRYNITPLSLACTNGDAAMVEKLIKAGADPNGVSEEGQTALMSAALSGKADAVKVLLSHGAKPNVVEPYKGQTALMWAASEGNTAAAGMMIEFGADVKAKSKAGYTPLLFAVLQGHIDTAKLLLDHGANVNDVAPDGTSALNMAVVNAYFELAGVLLDRGADPNAPDPRGSALHTLAWMRKPGADGAAGVGNTPHGVPVVQGNMTSYELAEALLKHGANPNVRITWQEKRFDKEGGTVKNPPNIQLGRHLLSYVGATPFYVAAQNGDAPYMRLLAEHGADGKLSTKFGVTPLMAAAGLGTWEGETPGPYTGCTELERLDAVKLALDLGNDINTQANFGDYKMEGTPEYTLLYYPLNFEELQDLGVGDPRWTGSTALHGAVVSGQPSIVQYLIDHGAKVDVKNRLGWTPMMLAQGAFYANAKKEFPAAASIIAQYSGPWFGTWKFVPEKSKYSPGLPPQSQLATLEPIKDGIRNTTDSVTASGEKRHFTYTAHFDGKPNTVTGNPEIDSNTYTLIDDHTYQVVQTKNGQTTITSRISISPDGKTRTQVQTGKNLKGETVNNTMVFERQ